MIIKICGITSLDDAIASIVSGVDMLGFNFYPSSPRHIFPQECKTIVQELDKYRPNITMVGVFVNTDVEIISRILDQCNLDLAQLSGDEPPYYLKRLQGRAFKALRPISMQEMVEQVDKYASRENPPSFLIDAYQAGAYGGTGKKANWSIAASLSIRSPILLAGGITPENVQTAIKQVRPWGIDVASGVEIKPGQKDHIKIQQLVRAARHI